MARVSRHLVLWLSLITFFALVYGSFREDYWVQFQLQLLFLPDKLIPAYITMYVLMPRLLLKEKYTAFFLWLILVILVSSFLHWTVSYYVERPLFYDGEYWGPFFYPAKILKAATYIYPFILIGFSIKFLKHWYVQRQAAAETAKERLESELKFLRTQLHPHFLFNTLNNLYALTLKKSDNAPELVLKLSDLMDYMLYECGDSNTVPLEREIQFVRNYFDIERLRYGDRLDIKMNVSTGTGSYEIAPMVFLPFLENAFKHGVSAELEKVWIHLEIKVEHGELSFEIRNSKPQTSQEIVRNGHGIGLKNVRRRLELQYGEEQFKLTTESHHTYYLVRLNLTL